MPFVETIVWILGIAKFVYDELEYQTYYNLKAIYLATNVLRGTDNKSDKNEKILYSKRYIIVTEI